MWGDINMGKTYMSLGELSRETKIFRETAEMLLFLYTMLLSVFDWQLEGCKNDGVTLQGTRVK